MSSVLSPTVSIIRAMKKSNDNAVTTVAHVATRMCCTNFEFESRID